MDCRWMDQRCKWLIWCATTQAPLLYPVELAIPVDCIGWWWRWELKVWSVSLVMLLVLLFSSALRWDRKSFGKLFYELKHNLITNQAIVYTLRWKHRHSVCRNISISIYIIQPNIWIKMQTSVAGVAGCCAVSSSCSLYLNLQSTLLATHSIKWIMLFAVF